MAFLTTFRNKTPRTGDVTKYTHSERDQQHLHLLHHQDLQNLTIASPQPSTTQRQNLTNASPRPSTTQRQNITNLTTTLNDPDTHESTHARTLRHHCCTGIYTNRTRTG